MSDELAAAATCCRVFATSSGVKAKAVSSDPNPALTMRTGSGVSIAAIGWMRKPDG